MAKQKDDTADTEDGGEDQVRQCCEFVDEQIDQIESKIAEMKPKRGGKKAVGAAPTELDPATILALLEMGLQFWKMIRDQFNR